MAEDEYEIMPHKAISELRDELARLKKNPAGAAGDSLQHSIESLSFKIDRLMDIFKEGSRTLSEELEEEASLIKKIKPMFDKIEQIIEQNEKIATGMVALADLVKGEKPEKKEAPPDIGPPGMGPAMGPPPGMGPPLGVPPPPMGVGPMPPPMPAGPPPGPPPAPPKKKGLFGR